MSVTRLSSATDSGPTSEEDPDLLVDCIPKDELKAIHLLRALDRRRIHALTSISGEGMTFVEPQQPALLIAADSDRSTIEMSVVMPRL